MIKTIKEINCRNTHDAYFEKDAKSEEGWYHFCDHIRRSTMPEIWKHDVHNYLYLGEEKLHITFCPICGKRLD